MRNYEIMYIVKSTLGEEEIKNVSKKFEDILTNNGAKIVSSKDMGQRELAYEINKLKNGYYFLLEVESENDAAIKEFDRVAKNSSDMIRHLITKIEK